MMRECIDALIAAEKAFENRVVEQLKAKAIQKGELTATQHKEIILNLMNKNMLPYLETMAKVPGGIYADYFAIVKEVIDSNNQKVKTRINRNK